MFHSPLTRVLCAVACVAGLVFAFQNCGNGYQIARPTNSLNGLFQKALTQSSQIPLNAKILSVSVSQSVFVGQKFIANIEVQNTGTQSWSRALQFKLGSQGPQDNMTWGVSRIEIPEGVTVLPGKTIFFAYEVTAPPNPGDYTFQWRMVQDGVAWFGDLTESRPMSVLPNDKSGATFISQSVPSMMYAGKTYPVSVTMRNEGPETWISGVFKLGSQGPQDTQRWKIGRVELPSNVEVYPGQIYTFNFQVTAPIKTGSQNFQWRMLHENVRWFGEITPPKTEDYLPWVNVINGVDAASDYMAYPEREQSGGVSGNLCGEMNRVLVPSSLNPIEMTEKTIAPDTLGLRGHSNFKYASIDITGDGQNEFISLSKRDSDGAEVLQVNNRDGSLLSQVVVNSSGFDNYSLFQIRYAAGQAYAIGIGFVNSNNGIGGAQIWINENETLTRVSNTNLSISGAQQYNWLAGDFNSDGLEEVLIARVRVADNVGLWQIWDPRTLVSTPTRMVISKNSTTDYAWKVGNFIASSSGSEIAVRYRDSKQQTAFQILNSSGNLFKTQTLSEKATNYYIVLDKTQIASDHDSVFIGYLRATDSQLTYQVWDAQSTSTTAQKKAVCPRETATAQSLISGFDWRLYYTQQTGLTPHATNFGSYATQALGKKLYLGLSTSTPLDGKGSILIEVSNNIAKKVGDLTEDGVHSIKAYDGKLLIPGSDPLWPVDDFSFGNFYRYSSTKGLQKFRNVPFAAHVLGIWEGPGEMFVGVGGAKDASGMVGVGQIWKSVNGGLNWSLLKDLNNLRVNDVIKLGGRLLALNTDSWTAPGHIAYTDDQINWTNLEAAGDLDREFRLMPYKDSALALNSSQSALVQIFTNGSVQIHPLPFQLPDLGETVFNSLVTVGDEIYIISNDGRIFKSNNLRTWRHYTTISATESSGNVDLISISYWADKNALVVGGRGTSSNIWMIPRIQSAK